MCLTMMIAYQYGDSNVSRVHYQDAVEHWWKQSGRGVKHSEINDIPPMVVNDDDSLDDECQSDYDAVEEPEKLPSDIANLSKEELCQVVDEEIKQICQHPARYWSEKHQQVKQIYLGDSSDEDEPSGSGGMTVT